MLDLLKDKLLKTVSDKKDETTVFYLKMCGDYYRYLAEFRPESDYKNQAKEFYGKAMDVAQEALNETHPTRLGLALNFSVCYYEILKEPEKTCKLAKNSNTFFFLQLHNIFIFIFCYFISYDFTTNHHHFALSPKTKHQQTTTNQW